MPNAYVLICRDHQHGQCRMLTEYHGTRETALAAQAELEALGWHDVTLRPVPPRPTSGRTVIACGGQLPLPRKE